MTTIISFINMKGGVGKTTISCLVAEFLSSVFGNRTLIIDLDPQINATLTFISESAWKEKDDQKLTLNSLFEDYINRSNFFDFENTLVKNVGKARQKQGSLDILPSSPELSFTQERLYEFMQRPNGRDDPELILRNKIQKKIKNYRFVIIDAPPNLGIISRNGLHISDYYIIPVIPDYLSTYGIDQLTTELKRTYQINVPPLGIVISRYKSYVNTHRSFASALKGKETLNKGPHVFNQTVRDTVKAEDFPAQHDSYRGYTMGQLFGYGGSNLESDIYNLTQEIIGEVDEIGH
jgi:chromosome partitioning protein